MIRSRVALAAVLVLTLSASAGENAGAAPPLLSQENAPGNIDSTFGSGNFGRWQIDEFGLPRYRYDLDETADARAKQAEISGSTLAQHQVGNDRFMANAYNDGFLQFWSQDRLMQWANRYQPADNHYSGGYGYLQTGGKTISLLYPDRPAGSTLDRYFGVGYFRKHLVAEGLDVTQDTLAPFGDDPLLVDEVTIRNTSTGARNASWFEYWDVNPYDQQVGFQANLAMAQPVWNAASRTLSVGQITLPEGDTKPLSIFAAALSGPIAQYETSVSTFFGTGTRAAPAEVVADSLSGTLARPNVTGVTGDTMFAFRAPVTLAPGESVTLRYAYGMAHPGQIDGLVAKYKPHTSTLAASEAAWQRWVPKADFGDSQRWMARELAWDAYLLRSASKYEEECGHHTITQGGYYQYDTGANLGYRSWPHYALPMSYAEPELAREILRYSIILQPPPPAIGQQVPYGTGQLCTRFDLGTSNDLDFWLLLAAGEYGLGLRDTAFFDEPLPYYATKQLASAWQHIKDAFAHQELLLGPHGDYIMGATGDWNDFSTELEEMTESTLVTAQLAYAYPKLAELADLRGDAAFATALRAAGTRNLATVRKEWTGKGWYSRGYSGVRQVGKGVIFEEPQPWAILAGAPSAGQSSTLVANIRRYLDAIGAPPEAHGPALFGTAMSPSRFDPGITEMGTVPRAIKALPMPVQDGLPSSSLHNASEWPGGVWFDLNGNLTWAYGALDGVIPGARGLAWDEYTRNTLANHATIWPDHWQGTISLDDVCHAFYSNDPERCGTGLSLVYDGQITEQPTWMVMDAIRLAGLTPTRAGYDIAPHLPFGTFSVRLPHVGIAQDAGTLRGYVRPEGSGPITFTVHLPAGFSGGDIKTWVNGHLLSHSLVGSTVTFAATGVAGSATDWAVTWTA